MSEKESGMSDYTPAPEAVEAFKAARHEADAEGDAGNRVLRGRTAAGPFIAAEALRDAASAAVTAAAEFRAALLAGSGEEPGEDECEECEAIARMIYSDPSDLTGPCSRHSHDRPAPVVPDVVRELDAVMHHHADRAD